MSLSPFSLALKIGLLSEQWFLDLLSVRGNINTMDMSNFFKENWMKAQKKKKKTPAF